MSGRRTATLFGTVAVVTSLAFWGQAKADSCADLGLGGSKAAIQSALKTALSAVAPNSGLNGGLNNEMWATLVDRDGIVCAVAFTGNGRNDQWPGSRVISAQKANTATSFSLPATSDGAVDALSTANLYTAVQPGGSLYGLQFSNPVNPTVAFQGNPAQYGTTNDPMVGFRIGGVNVFGGGLGLYKSNGDKVGAIGVSGDTSCADHNVAWRVRNGLGLDKLISGGVDGLGNVLGVDLTHRDNIIYDITTGSGSFPHDGVNHDSVDNSKTGFGHPKCGFGEDGVTLPANS
jgi:uncharacterized protein GlcG (DUF336 family)